MLPCRQTRYTHGVVGPLVMVMVLIMSKAMSIFLREIRHDTIES